MERVFAAHLLRPLFPQLHRPSAERASSRWRFGTTPTSTPGRSIRPGGTACWRCPHHRYGGPGTGGLRSEGLCPPCGGRHRPPLRLLLRTPAGGGTAKYAAEHGFTAFTSTLLASTYQNHEAIAAAAEMYARQYGVEFLYRDFRSNFRAGNQRAGSWGSICRSTAAASFPRRTAIRSRSTGTGQNLTRRRRPDRADELPLMRKKRPARQLPRRSFFAI